MQLRNAFDLEWSEEMDGEGWIKTITDQLRAEQMGAVLKANGLSTTTCRDKPSKLKQLIDYMGSTECCGMKCSIWGSCGAGGCASVQLRSS